MTTFSAEEREMLRSSVRGYFEANSDERQVRRLIESETGADATAWLGLGGELGIAGMLVPEAFGGLGLGARESVIVSEEAAYFLYGGPLLSSAILAPTALLASGDAAAQALYLPRLADGSLKIAVAIDDDSGAPAVAREESGSWRLDGAKTAVVEGAGAQLLLAVAANDRGRPGLFAVAIADAAVEPLDVFDRTRRQAAVRFADTACTPIGGDFSVGLERLLDVGAVAAAAEQLGLSRRMLEIAVDYAKIREQFGRPIGAFQAIKHLCADMLTGVECLRAAVAAAATAIDASASDASELASIAKSYGSEVAVRVAQDAIQVLGGIGFTWEHPAHLYLRRAKSLQVAFGDARFHRSRIAALLGLH